MIYVIIGAQSHLGGRNLTWGRRVPASALSSWGSMPQLGNTMIREGTRFVFACQGIEPCQANADAGTRRPQVRLHCPQVRLRPPGEIALLSIEIAPQINLHRISQCKLS